MNKVEKAAYDKVYYIKNREKKLKIAKIYNKNYRPQRNDFVLGSWKGYIPIEIKCQICGTKIYFNKKDPKNSVHFDHKDESNLNIKPNNWISDHECNDLNKQLWESFNFGMLCRKSNFKLPTKNREEWVIKAV